MRYLIDTHVLIWYLNGDKALPSKHIDTILEPTNSLCISIVSLWEITIKISRNKVDLGKSLKEMEEFILSKDYEMLPILFPHLNSLSELPYHHGDPFDRLLIAQAISEDLTIISADRHFEAYPVKVLW